MATLMFRKAWALMVSVAPTPSSIPKRSAAREETRRPRTANRKNPASTAAAPTSPSSSPITEKMKSEWGSGR